MQRSFHYMVGGDFKNIDGAFNEIQLALQQAKHDINESPVFRQHAQCEKLIDTQTTYQQVKNVGRALQQQEITLAFQPIVDTQFHECDYYECLARWITKEGSLIGAAQFIPIAEQYGLISLLDQLLLQNVLKELLLVPSLKLSVNVSAITASEGDWIKILENYMKSYSSLQGRIIIELTETAVFKNVEESYQFIHRLREIGCLIAIDDFGAGYMSFAHLRDKMAHIVKIDGRYIKDLSFNPHSLSFIRTIIGLTKPYGIKCVAECVETEEQAKTLALEGVMALQGYHLGKPSLQRLWIP
ncbi:MAG: EAL domain-containing protein [Proteobacteria bacterium]|nr:EAL domain-containing protein [Pseudomonadota bacterium]